MSAATLRASEITRSFTGDTYLPMVREREVRDPGRFDTVVGVVGEVDASSVAAAVHAARAAQPGWERLGVSERAGLLRAAGDAVDAMVEDLAALVSQENGSALIASVNEIRGAARHYRFSAAHAENMLGNPDVHSGIGGTATVHRRPRGVIAGIVPWNAPLVLAAQKVAPALATGNTVVLKPSPLAPVAVTQALHTIAQLLPAGVLSVVHGDSDVGGALISHPDVAMISFTGGGATAQPIVQAAAPRFARVHLELGGNDPAVILDDADIATTAKAVVNLALQRSGQLCFAIKRVYVPRTRMADFAAAAQEALAAVHVGHPLNPATTMGPVISADQRARIAALGAAAAAAGMQTVSAGVQVDPDTWAGGYYMLPTLVLDAQNDSPVVREEQFGPILPLIGYDSEAEAIELANATQYGLASSVWSADPERAAQVASRIEAGITFVNHHQLSPVVQEFAPFGGWKSSGIGWENSHAGLDEYLQYHSVITPPSQ
jgi:acyl-CoA reductase-like NAD-dependent aldehyde dehydrogenase